jgi:hypothetical protein
VPDDAFEKSDTETPAKRKKSELMDCLFGFCALLQIHYQKGLRKRKIRRM